MRKDLGKIYLDRNCTAGVPVIRPTGLLPLLVSVAILVLMYLILFYAWPWFITFVGADVISDTVRELVKPECLK